MNELYEMTNPVFNTAKMTLELLSAVGNEDAAAFKRTLGMEMPHVSGQASEIDLLRQIGAITIEMRYILANRMIEAAGNANVLDLACGYTPRAKYLMDRGYRYVGGDLPAVVEDMARVSKELLDGKALFRTVDVTNGASVRQAADLLPGPITISCEGLISYLDRSEMTAMVRNFAAVLSEHGGCWITTDFEGDHYFFAIAQAISGGEGEHFNTMVDSQVIKRTADAAHAPVFANDDDKLRFLKELGLQVERRPITDVAGMGLKTLNACTPAQRAAIEAALERINVWIMTPDGARVEETAIAGSGSLEVWKSLAAGALMLRLKGRLDSISAPELLGAFRTIADGSELRDITLDLSELEYTSSAGLRVMLLMFKRVGQGHFHLLNVNDTVSAVLEDTGFSEYFNTPQ